MNVLNVSVAFAAAVLAAIGTELLGAPEATAQRLVGTVSNHECHDCIPGDGGGGSSLVSEGSAFCIDGFAGSFPCDNVDLAYYYEIADVGGGEGNDCWGWTDPIGGKEYAIYGRTSGTSFIDISDPRNPIYLGDLPPHAGNSEWRDIKVYADHAFIERGFVVRHAGLRPDAVAQRREPAGDLLGDGAPFYIRSRSQHRGQ